MAPPHHIEIHLFEIEMSGTENHMHKKDFNLPKKGSALRRTALQFCSHRLVVLVKVSIILLEIVSVITFLT